MKAVIREHIEQLDVNKGGGIVSEKIRVDTIENPMLVIGLGGTGIDAMLSLKYQVNRRFVLPENPITRRKEEKPDNIEFIGFETNQGDKNKIYPPNKGIGLDLQKELVLLSNAEIGAMLKDKTVIDPSIREWLSPELSEADGTNGAGGIRQLGRLLLFTKSTEVIQSLRKKINLLLEGTNERLMVFILSGLSGGTGSGCFLDIAYIIRGIMEERYGSSGNDRVKILGYLFTPDVNLSRKNLNMNEQENIKKNGYAALKELDYWMNVDERKEDAFRQRYMNILEVNSKMPPFDLCHLISATNVDGKLLDDAYDYCMNVTAENITNFMANETKHAGHEFAIHDYMSNIRANINNMHKPYQANYKYNIIGAASAVLPIEEITTYLAYRLFDRMSKMFKAAPTEQDVNEFVRVLRMDSDSINGTFQNNIREPFPGYENSERFSYDNVIKTQSINVESLLKDYLGKCTEEFIKVRRQLPEELLKEFKSQVERIFLDPSKGPFYASRLINLNGGYCLLRTLEAYIESSKSRLQRLPEEIEERRDYALDKLAEARKAVLFGKEKKKNDYIEAKFEEYIIRAEEEKIKRMIEFYEDLVRLVNEQNSRIYGVFVEVLNELSKIFNNNSGILMNPEEKNSNGVKTYYWNIISVPDIARTIDAMVDEKNADELIRNFTNELLLEARSWTDEQEINIVASISNFLSDKFGDLITKSMEDFLRIKFGDDKPIDRLVETTIADRLDKDAIPSFYLNNSAKNLNLPSWGLVSVPIKSPAILKGIKEYQSNALGKSNFTIKESKVTNRIFWLNTKNGVPLYAYTPLAMYERAYEDTIFTSEGIGRHLAQTVNNNWTYFPSPIPEKSRGQSEYSERIRKQNNEAREEFDKGLKYGCIHLKNEDNKLSSQYECIVTEDFTMEEFLKQYNIGLENNSKINYEELQRCLTDLKTTLNSGLKMKYTVDIFNSFNEDTAKDNYIRSPKVRQLAKNELTKYEEINNKIAELEAVLESAQNEKNVFENFFEAIFTNTICKKGVIYVYDKDEEEREEWEPFVNLMKCERYPEYDLYKNYCITEEKKKRIIKLKSSKRLDAMLSDTEALLNRIQALIDVYVSTKEELKDRKAEMLDGTEKYDFYQKMSDKLSTMKKYVL